jgi:hypothetical protein
LRIQRERCHTTSMAVKKRRQRRIVSPALSPTRRAAACSAFLQRIRMYINHGGEINESLTASRQVLRRWQALHPHADTPMRKCLQRTRQWRVHPSPPEGPPRRHLKATQQSENRRVRTRNSGIGRGPGSRQVRAQLLALARSEGLSQVEIHGPIPCGR